MGNASRTPSIHILDDDSLLHVFDLYRPFLLGEDENDATRLYGGSVGWDHGRWWYKLAHVCQRWRHVILGSASNLGLSLVCTTGTPVADMIAHSPPLPLVIDYRSHDIITEDEEALILALKHHDRVRRIRLALPHTSLQKPVMVMKEEYPILDFLVIVLQSRSDSHVLFPESLQAPHLRHVRLQGFSLPIGSRLLTTAVSLLTFSLVMDHPSTYFHPNTLHEWISLMPLLETLTIYFEFSVPNRDVLERLLMHTSTIAPVTFPNLRHFQLRGIPAYLEAVVHRITAPRLEKLKVEFFNQMTFSVPRFQQFLNMSENLRLDTALMTFSNKTVDAAVCPYGQEEYAYALGLVVNCSPLDWQVFSMTQISNSLSQMFSAVEHLYLQHRASNGSSNKEHNEVDCTEWRELLRPFRNVKTLLIEKGLVKDLSRCLKLEDGELPLFPELRELRYWKGSNTGNAFTSFIQTRRNAGRPVTLVCYRDGW